jgi:L-iditol 2-dehydrogenase
VLRARGVTRLEQCGSLPEQARTPAPSDFDFVIETVATEVSLSACLRAVKPGGIVLLRSRPATAVPLELGLCVTKDVTLYGLSYGSFDEAIGLLASGALQVDDLLAAAAPLEDFARVFELAEHPQAPKYMFALATEEAALEGAR